MDIGDLNYIRECYNCGCLYLEYEDENKFVITDFLCKGCKKEEDIKKQMENKND